MKYLLYLEMAKCKNCGAESPGRYCIECGQELDPKRLAVKTILHDVTHGILHWENSILKTLKHLILKPGNTAKDYISGKRKAYVKPFSYFIFMQTLFVIVFHLMSDRYFAFMNVTFKSSSDTMQTKVMEIQHLVSNYVNYLNYFMPVVFAFYLYLFFRKRTGINYAEAMAASFYWVGTTLVFSIILMLLAVFDIRVWNARFLISILFYIFAIVQFSGMPKLRGAAKGIILTFLSYLSFVLFVLIFAGSYLYFVKGINIFRVFSSSLQ
jgi:Protein of unknown function (DUF3667)